MRTEISLKYKQTRGITFTSHNTNTLIKVIQFLDSSGRRENPMEKLVRVYKFNALYIYQMSNNLKL